MPSKQRKESNNSSMKEKKQAARLELALPYHQSTTVGNTSQTQNNTTPRTTAAGAVRGSVGILRKDGNEQKSAMAKRVDGGAGQITGTLDNHATTKEVRGESFGSTDDDQNHRKVSHAASSGEYLQKGRYRQTVEEQEPLPTAQ
jgi:hypothetical protein